MNSAFHRLLLSCIFTISLFHVRAQWTYACNDTMSYHNHQDGELMIQKSTNKLFSMQKEAVGNQYRVDYKENDQWNNVLTGTDGVDFVVTEDQIYVLRKVAAQFVLENYDLSGNLNGSSTSSVLPGLTGQFGFAELLRAETGLIYIHFVDPGFTNGGSVFLVDGSVWSDLNSGRFEKILLNNAQVPTGLKVTTQQGPPLINFIFKEWNAASVLWDSICTVPLSAQYGMSDFIISTNDSIYLATITSNYPNAVVPNLNFYALKNNVVVPKQGIPGLVNEYLISERLVEDKNGDILLYYSFRELGPWSMPAALRWKPATQTWIGFSNLSPIANPFNSEFNEQICLYHDAVVDESNTYYVDYSFHTDVFMSNGADSIHSHIRKFNNCGYTAQQNTIDTLNGQLVSQLSDYYEFQWINCLDNSEILGATTSSLAIPGNGMYALVVSSGECSDTSDCFDLSTLSSGSLSGIEINLYPNPASDHIVISNLPPDAYIIVSEPSGKMIAKFDGKEGEVRIQTQKWAPGAYIIGIETLEHTIRRGFVKQ